MQTTQARVIGIISRAAHHYMKKIGEPYQINAIECLMLLQIAETPGMTQEQISSAMVIDKSITTRAMQKFQSAQWIHKTTKTEDKRSFAIELAEQGHIVVQTLNKQLNRWNDYLAMGESEEDMAKVFAVLDRMAVRGLAAEEQGYGVLDNLL